MQTTPSSPTSSAIRGTVIGGMAAQTGQVMANDAANMPIKQVLISKQTTIGIQFVGPVLSTDELSAGVSELDSQKNSAFEMLGSPAAQTIRQVNSSQSSQEHAVGRLNAVQPN